MRVSALLLVSLFCLDGHALRGSPDIRSYQFGYPGLVTTDTLEEEDAEITYQCPAFGMGHFRNITRCDGYFLCFEGEGSHQLCPKGMLYNPEAPSNTYPCEDAVNVNVTCDSPPIDCPPPGPSGPPGPPGTPGQQGRPGPPSMCLTPAPVGPMPPSVRPMPPSVRPMPPSVRPMPPSVRPMPPSLRPILPSSPTLMPPMLSPPPVCPDSVRRHFPASDSCSSFYECRKGVAERRECPYNLLYNVDSHHTRYPCDYFYNVVCVLQSPPSGSFPHPQQQQQRHYELDQHKKIFNFYTYVTNKW